MNVTVGRHRLLSAVVFISLGAVPVVATLAGCGANSKGPLPASLSTTPSTGFAGRSFSSVIALSGAQRGIVNLSVNSAGRISGTLNIQDPTRALAGIGSRGRVVIANVNLSGTANLTTGAFTATGNYANSSGQIVPVSLSGTLPFSGSGGRLVVQLSGKEFTSTFTPSTTNTGGGGTPTPGGTATPTPTPTGTGTPTPTPTPTPTGTGTLSSAYFVRHPASDILVYRDVTTTTSTFGGQTTTETTTTTTNDDPSDFGEGRTGVSTQVNLNGVTVTRQETLDDNNRVNGFVYFTQDANAYTFYGQDTIEPAGSGTVTSTTRVSPALRLPFNLTVGQTFSQSVTFTTTQTGEAPVSFTYNYAITLQGFETVTVPAGTFTNTAKTKFDLSFNEPGTGGLPGFAITISATNFIAPNVGTVKSNDRTESVGAGFSSVSTSDIQLQSAVIGGKNYP